MRDLLWDLLDRSIELGSADDLVLNMAKWMPWDQCQSLTDWIVRFYEVDDFHADEYANPRDAILCLGDLFGGPEFVEILGKAWSADRCIEFARDYIRNNSIGEDPSDPCSVF